MLGERPVLCHRLGIRCDHIPVDGSGRLNAVFLGHAELRHSGRPLPVGWRERTLVLACLGLAADELVLIVALLHAVLRILAFHAAIVDQDIGLRQDWQVLVDDLRHAARPRMRAPRSGRIARAVLLRDVVVSGEAASLRLIDLHEASESFVGIVRFYLLGRLVLLDRDRLVLRGLFLRALLLLGPPLRRWLYAEN